MSWFSNLFKSKAKPTEIVSYKKLNEREFEVVLSNGLVARGTPGYSWYSYPSGKYIHWNSFGFEVADLLQTFDRKLKWGLIQDKEIQS